jgi:hypothetical protein
VSLANLLIDLRLGRGTISDTIAEQFLEQLRRDPEGLWLRRNPPDETFFKAERIEIHGRGRRNSPTMLNLRTFSRHYAWCFGKKYAAGSDQMALWADLQAGGLRVQEDDLHLSSHNGCVWFTDEKALQNRCTGLDRANEAYDCLGLNWGPDAWTFDGTGQPTAHAVLLVCSLENRDQATRGIRFPTAVEAWGSVLWAPADTVLDEPWRGNRTRHPQTGAQELPEGIHGPLLHRTNWGGIRADALGGVSGTTRADRLTHFAAIVFERALTRLQQLLG